MLTLVAGLFLQGCTACFTDSDGDLHALGLFVHSERELEHGTVRRLFVPGLRIELAGPHAGVSLGLYSRREWLAEERRFEDVDAIARALLGELPAPEPDAGEARHRALVARVAHDRTPRLVQTTKLGIAADAQGFTIGLGSRRRVCALGTEGDEVLLLEGSDGSGGPDSVIAWVIERGANERP